MSTDVVVVAYDQQMLYTGVMRTREQRRSEATYFVSEVNSKTRCQVCGGQPIEWHHDDHPKHPNARVSSLRTQGASIRRIQKEMDRCIPLCRRHHMEIDGRLDNLIANHPRKRGDIITVPVPCSCCNRPTKPLRNGMCVTCDNHHSGRRLRKTASCSGCC